MNGVKRPYEPLAQHCLRFYLSAPNRTEFKSEFSRREYEAVKEVLSGLAVSQYSILHSLVASPPGPVDLSNSYISDRMKERGMSLCEVDRFYRLLRRVDKQIAIKLHYIEDSTPKQPLTWTANF